MSVRGSVDIVTSSEIRGWAWRAGPQAPVRVQAMLDHEVLGEASADQYREDLAAAGLGDGNCGYAIRLFRPIEPLYLPFLVVKVEDGDVELPRAPVAGLREFFSALHARFPLAGRHRAVLGGLWTDRTDAAAVLRGKLKVGLAAETATATSALINEGYSVLDFPSAPVAASWRETPAECAADAMEVPAVLAVLQAVFEDTPVALDVAWLGQDPAPLTQASVDNPAPSPAECLDLLIPFGDNVALDVVRGSQGLPEFTPNGVSRWYDRTPTAGIETAATIGLLDEHMARPGTVLLIGPGLIHRVRCGPGSEAVRVICVPSRQTPLALANDPARHAVSRASGVRVLL